GSVDVHLNHVAAVDLGEQFFSAEGTREVHHDRSSSQSRWPVFSGRLRVLLSRQTAQGFSIHNSQVWPRPSSRIWRFFRRLRLPVRRWSCIPATDPVRAAGVGSDRLASGCERPQHPLRCWVSCWGRSSTSRCSWAGGADVSTSFAG